MSLSYTAKKNEIPSVYVVSTGFYRNFEVESDGEVTVHDEETNGDFTLGVYSNAAACASAVWSFMTSHEVTDSEGPIEHLAVMLVPLDEGRQGRSHRNYNYDLLACISEEAARELIEALKL